MTGLYKIYDIKTASAGNFPALRLVCDRKGKTDLPTEGHNQNFSMFKSAKICDRSV